MASWLGFSTFTTAAWVQSLAWEPRSHIEPLHTGPPPKKRPSTEPLPRPGLYVLGTQGGAGIQASRWASLSSSFFFPVTSGLCCSWFIS